MEQALDVSNFENKYSFWNWSAACASLTKAYLIDLIKNPTWMFLDQFKKNLIAHFQR